MPKNNENFWEAYQHQQLLFDAQKSPNESLAKWAARLTKLGEKTSYEPRVLDNLLRDKFITGLDAGPLLTYFGGRKDLRRLTFHQVLDVAFTKATQFEKKEKAKADNLCKK